MIGNFNSIMPFMQVLKSGNPEQAIMSMLQSSAGNNPILQNLYTLAQNKDTKQIETIARNMAKERGLDFDKEFNSFRQMFGL